MDFKWTLNELKMDIWTVRYRVTGGGKGCVYALGFKVFGDKKIPGCLEKKLG